MRFIVVGGIAAVLHRVPITTQDFDVVHDRAEDNVTRLLAALAELGAIHRGDSRRLQPNATHLRGAANQLLEAGNLHFDLLGAIDFGGGYAELLPASEVLEVGDFTVRVLSLEKLIEMKRQLPRPKDKLMLMQLEGALEERETARRGGR